MSASFKCNQSMAYVQEYVVAYCKNNNMTCVCSTIPAFTITDNTLQMDIYIHNRDDIIMEFKRRVGDVFTALHLYMEFKRALSNEPVDQPEQHIPITTELYDYDTLQNM